MQKDDFSVVNKTKGKLPSLPLVVLKDDILGKKYSLSVAFVSEKKSREINKAYRGIDKPTNILSFLLTKNEGEILLCPNVIKKQTKKFDRNFKELLGYLVIHGMLHLKGFEHSKKMENLENLYCKKFKFK